MFSFRGWCDRHPLLTAVVRGLLWTAFFLFVLLIISLSIVGWWGWQKFLSFTTAAHIEPTQLWQEVHQGWSSAPRQQNGATTVLVLGTDQLSGRGDAPVLTDSMMLVTYQAQTNQVAMLSLPRDLWSSAYKTRINALYHYGLLKTPQDQTLFVRQTLEEMTGVPIQYVVVLDMSHVQQVIDMIGGIEVNVAQGFTDPQFPRADVDVTRERDPAKLYETVTFPTGMNTMDGATALKYMRSRHSGDDQGTDDARSLRQKDVIQAFARQLISKKTLMQPEKIGSLFYFYQQNYQTQFPWQDAVSLAHLVWEKRQAPELRRAAFTYYPDDQVGVLTHPDPKKYKGEWVYEIRDPVKFREFVNQALLIPAPSK